MAWFLTKKKKSAGRSTKKPSPTASQRRQQVLTAGAVIALAALIFAKWKPVPVMFACLLFGFLDAVAIRLQGQQAG